MIYISHARTPEELQAEVLSDLRRRIALLDGYATIIAKGAAERARIARAQTELTDMLSYWSQVKIERPKTKREQEREQRSGRSPQDISSGVTQPHTSNRSN